MGKKALGLIETVGKLAAIEAMDAAAKAANIEIVGLENSRGSGRQTVKIMGEVSAVQAAVDAAVASVSNLGDLVYSHKVIARPSDELEKMLEATLGDFVANSWYAKPEEVPKKEKPAKTKAEAVKPKSATAKKAPGKKPVCNLCNDPLCERAPGERKTKCIHYAEFLKVR